jgi:hypothetical protein
MVTVLFETFVLFAGVNGVSMGRRGVDQSRDVYTIPKDWTGFVSSL